MTTKVPMPPPITALPTSFPARADMKPAQQRWVDEIRELAHATTAAVLTSQQQRKDAKLTRSGVAATARSHKDAVDKGVDRMSESIVQSLKLVQDQLQSHQDEMGNLLRVRSAANAKLTAAQKPLKDMVRRLEYHDSAMPPAERVCSTVEAEIRAAGLALQTAIAELSRNVQICEQHLGHMQEIRTVLLEESAEREAVQEVNGACLHSEARSKLPNILPSLSNGSLPAAHLSSVAGSGYPSHSRQHSSSTTTPPQHHSAAAGVKVRQNVKRSLELSAVAVHESIRIREQLRAASKQVDVRIAAAVDAVRSSLSQRVADNKSLQAILRDRLSVTETELAAVNEQIAAIEQAVDGLQLPTEVAHTTRTARKLYAKRLSTVIGDDPVAPATARELGVLTRGAMLHTKQLQALHGHRHRLEALISKLREALDSKTSLLAVDERLLHIGLTPSVPSSTPSVRSGSQRSARSAR